MNVADSYEIAIRRLSRLGHNEAEEARARRMHDLEELATLACDENERLTAELATARSETDRLRRQVAVLQQQLFEQSEQPFAPRLKPRGHGGIFYFFLVLVILAWGLGAATYGYRPSYLYRSVEGVQVMLGLAGATVSAAQPTAPVQLSPPPAPVKVEAPAPTVELPKAEAPKAAPVAPAVPAKAEPAVPAKVEAAVPAKKVEAPKVEPVLPAKVKAHRHHAPRHRAVTQPRREEQKQSSPARSFAPIGSAGVDDPLGGLNL
jgi:hypothetical protein